MEKRRDSEEGSVSQSPRQRVDVIRKTYGGTHEHGDDHVNEGEPSHHGTAGHEELIEVHQIAQWKVEPRDIKLPRRTKFVDSLKAQLNMALREHRPERVKQEIEQFNKTLQEMKNKLDAGYLPEELKKTFVEKVVSLITEFEESCNKAVCGYGKVGNKGKEARQESEARSKDLNGKAKGMNEGLERWNHIDMQKEQFCATLQNIREKTQNGQLSEERKNEFDIILECVDQSFEANYYLLLDNYERNNYIFEDKENIQKYERTTKDLNGIISKMHQDLERQHHIGNAQGQPEKGALDYVRVERQRRPSADLHDTLAEAQEVQRVTERRERIEHLLHQLPVSRPTLDDLPERLWWKVYLDAPLHKKAMQKKDPGKLFDEEQSPGYQQSMIELFRTAQAAKQANEQKPLDYGGYTHLHELATQYVVPSLERDRMRRPNGLGDKTWVPARYHLPPIPENGPERQERLAALEEMYNERINGISLFVKNPYFGVEQQKWLAEIRPWGVSKLIQKGKLPQGITMGTIQNSGEISIEPCYSESEGPQHITAILESYYEGRKTANQTPYHRLREIARTTRALHVTHQKHDGNGRTNVYGFVNKSLLEEGFSPTILPSGPGVFGGKKTLDGLVEDILIGMHSYIKEVERFRTDEDG